MVMVTSWPEATSVAPPTKRPRRIFGPWTSWRSAIGLPVFRDTFRISSTRARWSSWVPWEKFSRATSMPARIIASRTSAVEDEGPMVQMIRALRMAAPGLCEAVSVKCPD